MDESMFPSSYGVQTNDSRQWTIRHLPQMWRHGPDWNPVSLGVRPIPIYLCWVIPPHKFSKDESEVESLASRYACRTDCNMSSDTDSKFCLPFFK